MGKGLLFFCCSCCILVLTIINLSVGPIVSGTITGWGLLNCEENKDNKDIAEKAAGGSFTDEADKYFQSQIDFCTRAKGMHDMEYTAFVFDIVIGFICGLIGLLHLFDLKKDFVSNTGLIGLICGVIGFVLTFVYVIFNGLVFTGKYSDELERDGDGIFAELVDQSTGEYKCINYDDSGDYFWGNAKISDLNKKQYNYKHKFYETTEAQNCEDSTDVISDKCKGDAITNGGTFKLSDFSGSGSGSGSGSSIPTTITAANCKNIYAKQIKEISNKDKFDRFLTTLILSLVVCLANIGLALFGFLLFRTPGDF